MSAKSKAKGSGAGGPKRANKFLQCLCCICKRTPAQPTTLAQNSWLFFKALTCDKLSHCLFDFDCENLDIYDKEVYNYQEIIIGSLEGNSEADSQETLEDSTLFR